MDIGSGSGYPSAALSNFAPYQFVFDGVECSSMEGLLQSFKFASPEMQKHVCTLVGKKAKFKGKKKPWYKTQTLYWKGKPINRHSDGYQELITAAYDALFQNQKFRNALKATHNATLTHSIGKNKKNETILTESEFCSQLYRLRNSIAG